MFRTIRWRIAVPYIVLILLVIAGLVVHLSSQVRNAEMVGLQADLTGSARVVAEAVSQSLAQREPGQVFDTEARRYASLLGARVTLIAADGTVLGESHDDRATMENHLNRPEIQQALSQGQGYAVRFSRSVGYQMMYVAVPVQAGGITLGVARVALPLRDVEAKVARLRNVVISAGLVAALCAAALAVAIAAGISRPVRRLTQAVEQVAQGEYDVRLVPASRDEIGALTRSFNAMSDRLQGSISLLTEERGLLRAVLENMDDGVIITDGEGLVRLANAAVARLLGVDRGAALGRPFAQVTRDHRIIELWRRCGQGGGRQVETVEFGYQGPFLQAVVTPLPEGGPQACVVILRDLTRVRQLETVRRDFVSNISHELRTPLAALKALVDTLRDGALDDPPAAQRFLDRMETEVDALAQMVRELLELSRIESGQVPFRFAAVPVADLVLPPVERLRPLAARADVQLSVNVDPEAPAVRADAERVQQVVTNLVHNAIKFTPAGGAVQVGVSRLAVMGNGAAEPSGAAVPRDMLPAGEWGVVEVRDTGVGIPADALPRIFERFYKADRARSGGGTGLGLAIAKHIVQGHGGRIWATSIEGQGSTFFVALPASPGH